MEQDKRNFIVIIMIIIFITIGLCSMAQMFQGCEKLTRLDLSKFDISALTSSRYMFRGCSGLANLDISNFTITEKLTDYTNMFYQLSSEVKIRTNSAMADWIKTNFTYITDSNIDLVTQSTGEEAQDG